MRNPFFSLLLSCAALGAQPVDQPTDIDAILSSKLSENYCTAPRASLCDALRAFQRASSPPPQKLPDFAVGPLFGGDLAFVQTRDFPDDVAVVFFSRREGKILFDATTVKAESPEEAQQALELITQIRDDRIDEKNQLGAYLSSIKNRRKLVECIAVKRGYSCQTKGNLFQETLLRFDATNAYIFTFAPLSRGPGSYDSIPSYVVSKIPLPPK